MAFLGQTAEEDAQSGTDMLKELEERSTKLATIANYRNQIVDEHKGTPLKLAVGSVIGLWLLYHFLIKR